MSIGRGDLLRPASVVIHQRADPLPRSVLVALPAALLRDLLQFSARVGVGGEDDLDVALADLVSAVRAAVPCYRGMVIGLKVGGLPVIVADFLTGDEGGGIVTSLRLPFASLNTDSPATFVDDPHTGRVVFYAARPGAFVELAADLAHALGVPVRTGRPGSNDRDRDGSGPGGGDDQDLARGDGRRSIVVDADLPPQVLLPGISGLEELSTLNRAIGILIDQGHDPDQALRVLHQGADAAGVEPNVYAARLLGR